MGTVLYIKYGPQRSLTKAPESIVNEFVQNTPQMTSEIIFSSPTTETTTPIQKTPATPTKTPEPEWMTYNGLDLRDQDIEVLVLMNCNSDSVYLPSFTVIPWYPDVFTQGDFLISANNSVAWDHLGFYGLWIHSGLDSLGNPLAAYPLQNYLERDARGYMRYPEEFEQAVQECLIGSQVRIKQGDTISINKVVAAVRIVPEDVEEVSRHVMDLVPYLAENYPGKGFELLESPGMLFYFCGRALSGESKNLNENYWVQARIIIGFEPAQESEFSFSPNNTAISPIPTK